MRGRLGALFTAESTAEAASLFKRTAAAFGLSLLLWGLYFLIGVPILTQAALPAWAIETGILGGISVEVLLAAAVIRAGLEYLAWIRQTATFFQ